MQSQGGLLPKKNEMAIYVKEGKMIKEAKDTNTKAFSINTGLLGSKTSCFHLLCITDA